MEKAPLETAALPADTEDVGDCKKRPAGPPPQQDQAIALEIQSYFHTETLNPEEDPLTWWRDAQMIYPCLSNLAGKYLCIPAASSSSERVFGTSGNIVSCLRSSLKPEHVNRLVFLAKNL